jgi:chemotaxis protein methyltransferase CheR
VNETEYSLLKKKIQDLLKIDIDSYKSQQMRRRLEAFVERESPRGAFLFCRKLDDSPDQLKALRDMLTINVSEFFRDAPQFEYLRTTVLPEQLRNTSSLKIWTAACSHGAEPYSVAISLDELNAGDGHKILATDIDPKILAQAGAGGPYRKNEIRNVSSLQLQKYFVEEETGHKITEKMRPRIEFREHNLLSDRFETGFDLILCRNVMIYFSVPVKQQLFQRFHASLKPGGILFLGGTEAMLGEDSTGFEKVATNFYRKGDSITPAVPETKAA